MDKKIYISATAHLDTTWLWTLQTSIKRYLPETLNRNFMLFEKYPDYKFSFEGSYRYELIEEYYPEQFENLKKYVAEDRWYPAGSCYENGDVNIPSPEALIRNVLYGTNYFIDRFGKTSNDIFLPDCFGFGAALPSIAAHCGLKGFTTGKLSWGSANGVPFDIGRWYGNDNKYIYASIKPGSYVGSFSSIRTNQDIVNKLNENTARYNMPVTFAYHGAGDRGGSPAEESVQVLQDEVSKNDSSDIKVISSYSSEIFKDLEKLEEENDAKLPEWHGEFLMKEHGAGSYTSRTVGKRWNRRNEQLADAAERMAVIANWCRGYRYPRETFEKSWKRVIGHQFHDDITGTSINESYKRSWNNYAVSMNMFAGEYKAAVSSISGIIDTSFCKGIPVLVCNPTQWNRSETVTAEINAGKDIDDFTVIDCSGNVVSSQIKRIDDSKVQVSFTADVPGIGFSVYDVTENEKSGITSELKVNGFKFENSHIKAEINSNGDIAHIIDKSNEIDSISSPIRFGLLDDAEGGYWPAWEIKYKDIIKPVREFPKLVKIETIENGPAKVVYKVTKKAGESIFTQYISLDEKAEYIKVYNEIEWRSPATLLKLIVNTKAKSGSATYDIGLGSISRPNNTENQYEVPAQTFADVTDRSGKFGLSVLSDSRVGWDKPGDSLIRLTCIHTQKNSFRWECSQHLMDFGLNRFSFALYPHNGKLSSSSVKYGSEFNQPLTAFITDTHEGTLKSGFSFAAVNNDNVAIRAIKLAEKTDDIIVRFNETSGNKLENIRFSLGSGIKSAYETNGVEVKTGDALIENGELVFDIDANSLKTFAVKLNEFSSTEKISDYTVNLPYNAVIATENNNKSDATTEDGFSIPLELLPDEITCGGVTFTINKDKFQATFPENKNRVFPFDSKKLHLLVLSAKSTKVRLAFDGIYAEKFVPDSRKPYACWDLYALGETGFIGKDDIGFVSTHTHSPDGDKVGEQINLFRYTFDIPEGAVSFTMLANPDLYILSAVTDKEGQKCEPACEFYDSLEKRECTFIPTAKQKRMAEPLPFEKSIYKKIPQDYTYYKYTKKDSRAKQITDIICDNRAKFTKR